MPRDLFRPGSPDLPASEWLARYVAELHEADDPDETARDLGCGSLEELLRSYEEDLWPEVERLAREDPVFRRALRSVWAYDSPMFRRREALLEELGEFRSTWIRFVVSPQVIGQDTPLSWRAVELEGSVPKGELARLLRSVADWCEETDGKERSPGQAPTGPPPRAGT